MLTKDRIIQILTNLPELRVAVVGDLFLDRYLELDSRLTEASLETGLDAYQITRIRDFPGAGGTVINNLAALGVGQIFPLTVIGQDGEGFELKRQLERLGIDLSYVIEMSDRRTPTYTKPLLGDGITPGQELNRLDIKNHRPTPASVVCEITRRLDELIQCTDVVIVADQVSEPECGVITLAVRERLAVLGQRYSERILFADSRHRIGLFRNVIVKPNVSECLHAVSGVDNSDDPTEAARELAQRTGRPLYCTLGPAGCLYVDAEDVTIIPGYTVEGPIDIVGAGDSATAGIVSALGIGTNGIEAGAFGNLVASITIRQLGTTGTATPEQVIHRWQELTGNTKL